MKTAPNQTLLKTKERVRTSVHIFRIGVGGCLRKRDYFTVRTERRSLVSGIYSWSKEKKKLDCKTGRSVCVKRWTIPTSSVCCGKHKMPAKKSTHNEALVLELRQ